MNKICLIFTILVFILTDIGFSQYKPQNDTIQKFPSATSSADSDEKQYTPQQDSAYQQDSKLGLNFIFWLQKGLDMSELFWKQWLKEYYQSPSNNLTESFAKMNSDIFAPTPSEIVQHEINRINALSIPTVYAFGKKGISVNLRSIGLLFGLVEDVSPKIEYTLSITADVEIIIYNVSAKVIATIFKGTQKAGKYNITWNGRDSNGKKAPSGNYVAEVRLGAERFVRKRIVIE